MHQVYEHGDKLQFDPYTSSHNTHKSDPIIKKNTIILEIELRIIVQINGFGWANSNETDYAVNEAYILVASN